MLRDARGRGGGEGEGEGAYNRVHWVTDRIRWGERWAEGEARGRGVMTGVGVGGDEGAAAAAAAAVVMRVLWGCRLVVGVDKKGVREHAIDVLARRSQTHARTLPTVDGAGGAAAPLLVGGGRGGGARQAVLLAACSGGSGVGGARGTGGRELEDVGLEGRDVRLWGCDVCVRM